MRVAIRVRPGASRTRVGGAYGERLVVAVGARAVDGAATEAALDAVAEACGFTGQITVKADPAMPRAAFMLDWGEGRASYDPIDAEARVAEAVRSALVAEGLHAEPLLLHPHLADET